MSRILPVALILALGCLLGAGNLAAAAPASVKQGNVAPAKHHGKHHKHSAHHRHHKHH
jgi:hypothetical protein